MDALKLMGIVRHIVGGVGGALIGFGLAAPEDVQGAAQNVEVIAGGLMGLIATVASIADKIQRK